MIRYMLLSHRAQNFLEIIFHRLDVEEPLLDDHSTEKSHEEISRLGRYSSQIAPTTSDT